MGRPLLILQEDELRYGIWADQVLEILPETRVTPLPGGCPPFVGICNYKGTMIPVVTIAQEAAGEDALEKSILIILRRNAEFLGIRRRELPGITEHTEELLPYEPVGMEGKNLQIGEIVRDGDPIFVLNPEQSWRTEVGQQGTAPGDMGRERKLP